MCGIAGCFGANDKKTINIGIWTGFDFAEEREKVKGTVDGDLKHEHEQEKKLAVA